MTNNFTPAKAGGQRPRLSKEEYAEKMKAEKEAVYQMADDAAKAIVSDPEKFKAFLDTQSRLDRYSAVNALLIFKQLPEASQLKNFDDWSKDNIKITKGAKSISILEPVEYAKRDGTTGISYNVKKVFDVSPTNGKRPPSPTVNRDPKALITTMLDSSPVNVDMFLTTLWKYCTSAFKPVPIAVPPKFKQRISSFALSKRLISRRIADA